MLEELGLGEAPSQDEADVLVFNTCTIREKPDQRLAAHLGNAAALKRRRPGDRHRRRRLLRGGAARADLRALPVRRRRVRPRLDPAPRRLARRGRRGRRARRFGIADERAFAADAADAPRAPLPGLGAGLDGLQLDVLVLHRPVACAAARSSRRPGEILAEVTRLAGEGVREITLLGQNVNSYGRDLLRRDRASRELLRAVRRGRRDRAHPLHEPASRRTSARRRDRGDGRVRRGLRARAPAAPVRLDARAQGDAAHVLARALPAARRASCAPRSPTSR